MPVFSQRAIEDTKKGKNGRKGRAKKGIPQEIVDEYKPFVNELGRKKEGTLEFGKSENMNLGRKALQEAGVQERKYVKVQKMRGEDSTLRFWRITKKEFDENKRKAKARGKKIKEAKAESNSPIKTKTKTKAKSKRKAKASS